MKQRSASLLNNPPKNAHQIRLLVQTIFTQTDKLAEPPPTPQTYSSPTPLHPSPPSYPSRHSNPSIPSPPSPITIASSPTFKASPLLFPHHLPKPLLHRPEKYIQNITLFLPRQHGTTLRPPRRIVFENVDDELIQDKRVEEHEDLK